MVNHHVGRRRSRLSTLLALAIAAAAGVIGLSQAPASAAVATYPVMNTSETLPDGVWFRNSPVNSDTNRETGFGVYAGESLAVDCWAWGDPVGPYSNHIWYRGLDVNRPTVNGHPNYGYLNTHYVNDGMTADHSASGVPSCTTSTPPPPPPPSVTPCTFNMRWTHTALTFNYPDKHIYYGNAWQAAKNWTNLGTPLTVTPAAATVSTSITFEDVNQPNSGWAGQAAVPVSWQTGSSGVPFTTHLSSYNSPLHILIYVNNAKMKSLNDFQRTLVLTHELGHALGLAHTDACGLSDTSVMHTGPSILSATYNTPMYYDRINLEQLYGFATG